MLARYVGSGGAGQLTSNDTAEFLWPELFRTVGTIGHEMICAAESPDRSLEEAEYEMMNRFVSVHGHASLLCDLVDANTVGLENVSRVMAAHRENTKIGIRVDSGDLAEQCVLYHRKMKEPALVRGLSFSKTRSRPRSCERCTRRFARRRAKSRRCSSGLGGYWWRLVHRDTVAAAFKRSATGDRPNVKFSNSPGKESLGGYLRVFAEGEALVVADAAEPPPGEPLMVKLVEHGRIVYRESFPEQAARAERTWGRYRRVTLSRRVEETMKRYRATREREIKSARERLAKGGRR